jgi:hypothetical protein
VDIHHIPHFKGVHIGFQRRLLGKSDDFLALGVTSTIHNGGTFRDRFPTGDL